jgi:hypothetical protein
LLAGPEADDLPAPVALTRENIQAGLGGLRQQRKQHGGDGGYPAGRRGAVAALRDFFAHSLPRAVLGFRASQPATPENIMAKGQMRSSKEKKKPKADDKKKGGLPPHLQQQQQQPIIKR